MTGWASLPARRWTCGHPHTDENTQAIGGGRVACRTCRRAIARESARQRRVHKRGPHAMPRPLAPLPGTG